MILNLHVQCHVMTKWYLSFGTVKTGANSVILLLPSSPNHGPRLTFLSPQTPTILYPPQGMSWLVTPDASCTAPWWELQQSLSFVVSPLQLIGRTRRDWTLELQDNVCQDLGQGMSCFIINTGNYLASGFFSWMVDLPGDLHRARFTILNLWLLFCFQYRCF